MVEKKSRKKDLNIPPFKSFFAFNLLFLMPAGILFDFNPRTHRGVRPSKPVALIISDY